MDKVKLIARTKSRFTRGYGWVALPGMGLLIAQAIQKYIGIPIYYILPTTILIMYFVGYFDDRLGIFGTENGYMAERNNFFSRTLGHMNKVRKK